MNETNWQNEVVVAVTEMKVEAQKAYTFMKQEAPEVAREYVAFRKMNAATQLGMSIFMSVAALAAIAALIRFIRKTCDKEEETNSDVAFTIVAGFGVLVAFGVAMTAMDNIPRETSEWIKIQTAPRVVILEGIKRIIQ